MTGALHLIMAMKRYREYTELGYKPTGHLLVRSLDQPAKPVMRVNRQTTTWQQAIRKKMEDVK